VEKDHIELHPTLMPPGQRGSIGFGVQEEARDGAQQLLPFKIPAVAKTYNA
jgi:hypothetical protein